MLHGYNIAKEKNFIWKKCIGIFVLWVSFSSCFAQGSGDAVDVVERISGFLSPDVGYELLETGHLDVDDDGDLDLLVEAHKDKNVIERGGCKRSFRDVLFGLTLAR